MVRLQPRSPRQWVGMLFATATAGYLCRVNLSIAGAAMMPALGLSQAQMGRVFSAFLLGYALFQLPGGYLADRFGAARVLRTLPWLWVTLSFACAVIPSEAAGWAGMLLLLALRFAMGAAAAPTYPASAQGVAQWIAPADRATANGWVVGSVGFGSAIAPILVSSVMVTWGWRASLVASAIPAAVVAFVWLGLKPPARPQQDAETPGLPLTHLEPDTESTPGRLTSRSFVLLTISYSLQGYVGYIFVFWFYLYLVQVRHFDLLSGALFSSLPWVLSMIAIPGGGILADRLVRGRLGPTWGRRIVPLVGFGASGILLSLGAHTANGYVAAVALALSTACILSVEGPFWATMNDLAGTRSGTGGGVMNTGCNIGGLISPALTPALGTALGWEPALHLAAGLAMIAGVLWFWINGPQTSAGLVGEERDAPSSH